MNIIKCFDLTQGRKQEQISSVFCSIWVCTLQFPSEIFWPLWSQMIIGKSVFIRQIWKNHILYSSILSMTYMIEIIFKKIKSCTFVPKYINFKNYKIKSWIGTTKDWDPVTKIKPNKESSMNWSKNKRRIKKEIIYVSKYQQKNYEKSKIWKSIWPNNKTWKSWTKLAWEDFVAMMDSNYSL